MVYWFLSWLTAFENEFLELNTMTQATASQINSSMASFANIAQKAAELGPLDTAVRASIESLEPFQTLDKESLENKLALVSDQLILFIGFIMKFIDILFSFINFGYQMLGSITHMRNLNDYKRK